jgi:hypothetical protein
LDGSFGLRPIPLGDYEGSPYRGRAPLGSENFFNLFL